MDFPTGLDRGDGGFFADFRTTLGCAPAQKLIKVRALHRDLSAGRWMHRKNGRSPADADEFDLREL